MIGKSYASFAKSRTRYHPHNLEDVKIKLAGPWEGAWAPTRGKAAYVILSSRKRRQSQASEGLEGSPHTCWIEMLSPNLQRPRSAQPCSE